MPRYKYRRPQRRFPLWPLLVLLALGVLIGYPLVECTLLEVDEQSVSVSNLPASLKNLRIVFLSDLHCGGQIQGSTAEKALDKLDDLSADIILFGGDYGSTTEDAIAFFENLPILRARVGAFAVLGDCEYTNPDRVSELIGVIGGRGITPLVNNVSKVKVGQSYLYIAGADDYNGSVPRVAELASQVSESSLVIFLSHSPQVMEDVFAARSSEGSAHWFDLALFGHTHGGQINLWGFTPFSALRNIPQRYLSGWVEENRASMLFSNGVGTEWLPARFRARPQIHVITLKSR